MKFIPIKLMVYMKRLANILNRILNGWKLNICKQTFEEVGTIIDNWKFPKKWDNFYNQIPTLHKTKNPVPIFREAIFC